MLATALSAAARGEAAALARITRGPADLLGRALVVRTDGTYEGTLGGHPELDRTAVGESRALLAAGRTGEFVVSESGSRCGSALTFLVESSVPPPRMIVFGAVDFAAALVRAGKFLGYHVTVCDARPVFATPVRLPEADDIVVEWPHRYLERTATDERTVLCVLTHDAKFDVPLLAAALRLPVAFVARWGRAAPTRTATAGSATSASPTRSGRGCGSPIVSTSAPARPRRPPCPSRRRSSRPDRAARACRSPVHGRRSTARRP